MPTARITEYSNLVRDPSGVAMQVHDTPPVAVQVIVYAGSTPSAALNDLTHSVRIDIEDDAAGFAHVAYGGPDGAAPVADGDSERFFHRQPESRGAFSGQILAFWDGST